MSLTIKKKFKETDLSRNNTEQDQKIDPLYVIFEQHLFHFQDSDEDRKTFVDKVVSDYLKFLRRKNVTVPTNVEDAVRGEIGASVSQMLYKKIYGFLSIEDFNRSVDSSQRRRAKTQYRKLG